MTGKSATTASLSWSAATDEAGGSGMAGYDVYRGTTKVGSSVGTTFTDSGLAASTAYSYTVQARCGRQHLDVQRRGRGDHLGRRHGHHSPLGPDQPGRDRPERHVGHPGLGRLHR